MKDDISPYIGVGAEVKVFGWAKIVEQGSYVVDFREKAQCTCYDGTVVYVINEHFMTIEFFDPLTNIKHEVYKAQVRMVER